MPIRGPATASRRPCLLPEPLEARQFFAATPLFDSGGFEAPRYTVGPLERQDAQGPWLKDTARVGVASVEAGGAAAGAQSVRLSRPAALNGDTRYGIIKPFASIADLDVLRVSWDMNVARNAQPGVSYGPFFGAEAYDAEARVPQLIGSLGVDATTGDVLYQDGATGTLTETGSKVTLGQWNHFALEVDYAADTYTVWVNGRAQATTGFVNDAADGFDDATIAALAASGDTVANASGSALFDNYRVEVAGEPTPPAVTGVYLSGSTWAAPFKRLMEGFSQGSAEYGYAVPAGARQLDSLPWDNVDRVTLTFNRDVWLARDDLLVYAASGREYAVTDFQYNSTTMAATWTLSRPVRAEALVLQLDAGPGGVRMRDGTTPLDGDWAGGADAFPSGDGTSGGDFRFRVNVVPGDTSRDGKVDAVDVLQVRSRLRVRTASHLRPRFGYSLLHDLNGDGRINATDLASVRREVGSALPFAEPAAAIAAIPLARVDPRPPRRDLLISPA